MCENAQRRRTFSWKEGWNIFKWSWARKGGLGAGIYNLTMHLYESLDRRVVVKIRDCQNNLFLIRKMIVKMVGLVPWWVFLWCPGSFSFYDHRREELRRPIAHSKDMLTSVTRGFGADWALGRLSQSIIAISHEQSLLVSDNLLSYLIGFSFHLISFFPFCVVLNTFLFWRCSTSSLPGMCWLIHPCWFQMKN